MDLSYHFSPLPLCKPKLSVRGVNATGPRRLRSVAREVGKGGHGVPDPGFAFRDPGRPKIKQTFLDSRGPLGPGQHGPKGPV